MRCRKDVPGVFVSQYSSGMLEHYLQIISDQFFSAEEVFPKVYIGKVQIKLIITRCDHAITSMSMRQKTF